VRNDGRFFDCAVTGDDIANLSTESPTEEDFEVFGVQKEEGSAADSRTMKGYLAPLRLGKLIVRTHDQWRRATSCVATEFSLARNEERRL
jgi:hypothetical protein